jgi:adenosylcobinamide-GDP ribazoletransferase
MSFNLIKNEINLILIALAFLTRIPVSVKVDFSQEKLNRASRYFSLVGWFVGGISASVFLLFSFILPVNIALLVSMLISILLTGSFHEDGLADTCDGFGGGWDKQQKLAIMKDSRLGTYGAVAIWFVLMLKYSLLSQLAQVELAQAELVQPDLVGFDLVVVALLIAHPLSRSISTSMIYFLPYVTDEEQSKVKPLAEKQYFSDFIISLMIAGIGLVFIGNAMMVMVMVMVMVSLLITFFLLRMLLIKQIGGFTGDTLGATQQISELVIYTVFLVGVNL